MKQYQEREVLYRGRYIQCQILNWQEGPPPKYLHCNSLDKDVPGEFVASYKMGCWAYVDLRDILRIVNQMVVG